jgi:hypothetical protein
MIFVGLDFIQADTPKGGPGIAKAQAKRARFPPLPSSSGGEEKHRATQRIRKFVEVLTSASKTILSADFPFQYGESFHRRLLALAISSPMKLLQSFIQRRNSSLL